MTLMRYLVCQYVCVFVQYFSFYGKYMIYANTKRILYCKKSNDDDEEKLHICSSVKIINR